MNNIIKKYQGLDGFLCAFSYFIMADMEEKLRENSFDIAVTKEVMLILKKIVNYNKCVILEKEDCNK